MGAQPSPVTEISGARVLAILGDSVTTDHISPAGSIKKTGPAGVYLQEHGVSVAEFNSYRLTTRNHEVMVRGTFANVRLRNKIVPGSEGGVTKYVPTGEVMSIYDASVKYAQDKTPLVVIAGKEYGSGSSRDWAAKGPRLLGVRAVIAQSYERIHRSNLVGMGILPLQFHAGENAESLGLTGEESIEITGIRKVLDKKLSGGREVQVVATVETEARRSSLPSCESIPRRRSSTTSMAGSCICVCGSCSQANRKQRWSARAAWRPWLIRQVGVRSDLTCSSRVHTLQSMILLRAGRASAWNHTKAENQNGIKSSDTAPDFELTAVTGEDKHKVKLSDYLARRMWC